MDPKQFRHSPAGRVVRAPTGYYAFVPNPLPPQLTWTPALVKSLSDADRALGQLAGLGRSVLNPRLLIFPFSRREAVLSSRIEGTRATLSDLYAYEAVQVAMFESSPDVSEVHNYVRAMEHGLERLHTLPLSLRLIREIHLQLMEGMRGEHGTPGEFRRSPNWIGPPGCDLNTAPYVPPPMDAMKAALDAFEKYLHAESELPPLVRLGLIHYQFEAIHPFLDGNGRIGRLLITLLMVAWDLLPAPLLYLSAYLEAHRQAYYDLLLRISQRGDWETWLLFFLEGIATQGHDAVARAERLQTLRERYRRQIQERQASAKLLQTVDFLFVRPLLTVQQLQDEMDVSFPTASKYASLLQDLGLLREITGQARNRVFRADEVLDALEAPLALGDESPPKEVQ